MSKFIPKNKERKNDRLVELFCEFISENETAAKYYDEIDKDLITQELILSCIEKTGFQVDEKHICTFIMNGVSAVENLIYEQTKTQTFGMELE